MTEQLGRSVSDIQLDRLVDGELSPREYQALVAALDREPDGWRRCALAFLEAQAWSQELPDVCAPERAAARVAAGPAPRSRAWSSVAALALAASLLCLTTFGLGWLGGGSLRPIRPARMANQSLDRPAVSAIAPPSAAAPSDDDTRVAMPSDGGGLKPWTDILIAGGENGAAGEIRLPLLPSDSVDAARLLDAESSVPPEVQRALRHLGYEFRRDRSWTRVNAHDQQVVVPWEQVEIIPVSNRAY